MKNARKRVFTFKDRCRYSRKRTEFYQNWRTQHFRKKSGNSMYRKFNLPGIGKLKNAAVWREVSCRPGRPVSRCRTARNCDSSSSSGCVSGSRQPLCLAAFALPRIARRGGTRHESLRADLGIFLLFLIKNFYPNGRLSL